MDTHLLTYNLSEMGYIDHWLLAGPQVFPAPNEEHCCERKSWLEIAAQFDQPKLEFSQSPRECDPPFTVGEQTFYWRYEHCLEDHLIDLSSQVTLCHYMRTWAYAELSVSQACEATIIIAAHGPVVLWLNGQQVCAEKSFSDLEPYHLSVPVVWCLGKNTILLRFDQVAMGRCVYAASLRIVELHPESVLVMLPTVVEDTTRRMTLEQAIDGAYLDRSLYSKGDEIVVRWKDKLAVSASLCVRFQDQAGRISAEILQSVSAGHAYPLITSYQASDSIYQAAVMPHPREMQLGYQQISKKIELRVLNTNFYETPSHSYDERVVEVLLYAARHKGGLFNEIARMQLGYWASVEIDAIQTAIKQINRCEEDSLVNLVGLLGMLYRYNDNPMLSGSLRQPLESCILGFHFTLERIEGNRLAESNEILAYCAEILAGQQYSGRVFEESSMLGKQHQDQGESKALQWLVRIGRQGFEDWDSDPGFEHIIVALTHLVEFANSVNVREMASIVLDKLFFSLAVNSYRGVFCSAHANASTASLMNPRLGAGAAIGRLAWGMGCLNDQVYGTVSLACSNAYELPSIIAKIAADQPGEIWDREQHTSNTGRGVNKVTYKTPDYMLSSVQDYTAGVPGSGEHIWQATLGPDAVVFVNHPACISETDNRPNNFWRGNRILPRTVQQHEVLISIHTLPEGDALGFTHAYFPIYAFDEWSLSDGWAFARKGEGYLALKAAHGLSLVVEGAGAYRELRSYGMHNIWVCHMGRKALDGEFSEFQARILELDIDLEDLSAHCQTLHEGYLTFSWTSEPLSNGNPQPINGCLHYENPYCTVDLALTPGPNQMDIQYGDQILRLHFNE